MKLIVLEKSDFIDCLQIVDKFELLKRSRQDWLRGLPMTPETTITDVTFRNRKLSLPASSSITSLVEKKKAWRKSDSCAHLYVNAVEWLPMLPSTTTEDMTLRTRFSCLHFEKWLTVSTSIGENGGTVSSPETDCFVEVPSHAFSAHTSVNCALELHCLRSSEKANKHHIFLDVVHVSFNSHLLKPADVFIRHHLHLAENKSSEICVYYCNNAAAGLPWTLIASLKHLNETVVKENGMKIHLRKDFVQITATWFCEFCLSVQGRVEVVAQVFIMRMPDCLQLEVFLTCNCDQAVKRAESEMTAERFTKKKVVPLFVDTEKRSDLAMRVSSLRCGRAGGWTTRREEEDRVVIPFQVIEKLLRNRAYPERRSFYCDRNIERGCDVTSLQVQLCFEGGGMLSGRKEWITAWELPAPPIPPKANSSSPGSHAIISYH